MVRLENNKRKAAQRKREKRKTNKIVTSLLFKILTLGVGGWINEE
jgi:hypothetical protein